MIWIAGIGSSTIVIVAGFVDSVKESKAEKASARRDDKEGCVGAFVVGDRPGMPEEVLLVRE
jgi:hypothetical protein